MGKRKRTKIEYTIIKIPGESIVKPMGKTKTRIKRRINCETNCKIHCKRIWLNLKYIYKNEILAIHGFALLGFMAYSAFRSMWEYPLEQVVLALQVSMALTYTFYTYWALFGYLSKEIVYEIYDIKMKAAADRFKQLLKKHEKNLKNVPTNRK